MTTAIATWPTAAEFTRVAAKLADAFAALDALGNFRELADDLQSPLDEAPVPTLDQFAAVSWFLAVAESDLMHMRDELDRIREARRVAAYTWPGAGGGRDAS